LDDPDNQRLLDQIGWHHAGGNLPRFLDQPEVAEPTNNRAERARCHGVIARKVSHCSSGLMDSFRSDNQASDPVPSDSASGAS